MNIERFVGLVFSISALLILLFVVLTPQVDYQQEFKIADAASETQEIAKIESEEESKKKLNKRYCSYRIRGYKWHYFRKMLKKSK